MKREEVDALERQMGPMGTEELTFAEAAQLFRKLIASWRKQDEALQFYADEKNWVVDILLHEGTEDEFSTSQIGLDEGKRAREVVG